MFTNFSLDQPVNRDPVPTCCSGADPVGRVLYAVLLGSLQNMSSSSVKQEEPPCSCAGDLPVLDSQGSQLSCLSLDLSQDTVARVLDGIGLSTTEGDR